jgi:hypothetical protein
MGFIVGTAVGFGTLEFTFSQAVMLSCVAASVITAVFKKRRRLRVLLMRLIILFTFLIYLLAAV